MKLFIWGTGRAAGNIIGKYIDLNLVEGFIDNAEDKKEYMGKSVFSPDKLLHMEYDAVLVANLYSAEIYNQCINLGIDLKRFIFLFKNYMIQDLNRDYGFITNILGEKTSEIIKKRYHMIRGAEVQGKLCLDDKEGMESYFENDYVRIKSFEMVVKEIRKRNLSGAVAEAGVFQGDFAQFINHAFPDKDLYLFDTFEGFDVNEALVEVKAGNCTDAFVQTYKQTKIDVVLSKMKYRNRVIIKQGIFPRSAGGLESDFAFVSLDMDFEESIYAGLEYFYPRLVEGGYIFIHDYNGSLTGVERAVDQYEKNKNIKLCKVPLCDANGTLVVTK